LTHLLLLLLPALLLGPLLMLQGYYFLTVA
jgi:hypothetical protein